MDDPSTKMPDFFWSMDVLSLKKLRGGTIQVCIDRVYLQVRIHRIQISEKNILRAYQESNQKTIYSLNKK